MSTIACKTLWLTLETLPAFPVSDPTESKVERVYQYLTTLIHARLKPPVHCLKLPNISELSALFNCSNLDLYDTLQALRASGYEYQFEKADTPILLWRAPNAKATSIRRSR